jgi:hypothetical protein
MDHVGRSEVRFARRLFGKGRRLLRRPPLVFRQVLSIDLPARLMLRDVALGDVGLRTLDRHRDAAVTSVIPSLSCRW